MAQFRKRRSCRNCSISKHHFLRTTLRTNCPADLGRTRPAVLTPTVCPAPTFAPTPVWPAYIYHAAQRLHLCPRDHRLAHSASAPGHQLAHRHLRLPTRLDASPRPCTARPNADPRTTSAPAPAPPLTPRPAPARPRLLPRPPLAATASGSSTAAAFTPPWANGVSGAIAIAVKMRFHPIFATHTLLLYRSKWASRPRRGDDLGKFPITTIAHCYFRTKEAKRIPLQRLCHRAVFELTRPPYR